MKVSLRLLREGRRKQSFEDEMAMEYRVATRVALRHDFREGVRAVLVDKDNAPSWSPPRIEDVDPAAIRAMFDG